MNASERILILAPRGRDAALASSLLAEDGREGVIVRDFAGLAAELEAGAGVAIIADEAIEAGQLGLISDWIEKQPPWSDFPFVFLSRRDGERERNPFQSRVNEVLGNVIFLERPFHPHALMAAVDNALRARRRQYQARADLDRLAAEEKRLAIALRAGRLGAWTLDVRAMRFEASDRCKANFGVGANADFDYDDLLGAVHQADRDRVRAALSDCTKRGGDLGIEFRIVWPDGNVRWLELRASVLPDRYNRILSIAGVSSDITTRKTAEEDREELLAALALERIHTQDALRGEKAFTGLLLGSVPAGIVAYDLERVITTWNPVMERLVGLPADEAIGHKLFEVIVPGRVAMMEPRVADALAGNSGAIEELEFPTDHAGPVWLESQHAPLTGGDGQVIGGVAFFRDVTERRQAEAQLRQAQKMETVGQLTGGVAHDFNNLLAAVIGNLDLLRKKVPQEPQILRHIDGAMQGAQRGAALTQRLLAFARRQDLQPEPVDLAALIEGMRGLMERSIGPMIHIAVETVPDLPPARVDPNQLELAILNLAVNARDAMPNGGRLTIRLDERTPPPELDLHGRYMRLAVEDTGDGMDADTLSRAIEPFFSTKERGKGTGLGLSMIHGLAVQLGGALHLESEPGVGTVAELWLPVSSQPVAEVTPTVPDGAAPPAAARILVVDDDALIAMNTVDMVEDLGHTVVEAYSGKQALEILESGVAIDAVITDYAMPGMTGVELAEKARALRPGLPILLATGYADLPSGTQSDLPRLGKPYQQSDLSERLGKLLSGR